MFELIKSLWKDESGQALVEYGLVLGLIAVAMITLMVAFRTKIQEIFGSIQESLSKV